MKKDFVLLKQCALALTLLITVSIILHSCKKDNHSQPKITAFDLQEAKNWVRLNIKTTETNPFKAMSPNWDNLYTSIVDNQTIIEVGLNNPDKIFVGDSPNDATEPNLGLSKCNIRLVLFKNADNNTIVSGCYMAVVNNIQFKKSEIHYKNVGDLTGKLYYFNTDGSFSNGSLYANGQIARRTANLNLLNESLRNIKLQRLDIKKLSLSIKDKIIAVKSPCADGIDIPIWGQSCVGVEGYEVCSPYISGFAHLPGSCDGDYGDNEGYGGTHGGYAGGSNNNSNRDIHNKTTDPCISKTVEAALDANKDVIGMIGGIISLFDSSKKVSLNIYEGVTDHGAPGQYKNGGFVGNTFQANITLQTSYFKNTSKESVITTLIHEAVHAYIHTSGSQILEDDHEAISKKYIDPMAAYLQDYFGMGVKEAYSMAWSGVPDSQVYKSAIGTSTFKMSDGNFITKDEIDNLALPYKDSGDQPEFKKGTPICN